MTAIVYNIRDYQSKAAIERANKALEEHLVQVQQEASVLVNQVLWHNDAGSIGLNPFYHAPEKDPA